MKLPKLLLVTLTGFMLAMHPTDTAVAQTSTVTERGGALKIWSPSGTLVFQGPAACQINVSAARNLLVGQTYYGAFNYPYSAGSEAAVAGTLEIWDAKGNVMFNGASTGQVQGPQGFAGDYGVESFAVMIAAPTPTPTPTPVPTPTPTPTPAPTPTPIVQGSNPPVMPSTPPAYVTDCPTLAFSDTFNEGANFNSTLSEWGPIAPPVKWIVNKPDGLNFGGYYQQNTDRFTYNTSSGHLVLQMHNYYQNTTFPQGDGNWYTGAIATAALKNQTGGGPTTGFLAKAPCYWETAVWIPQLTDSDVPNAAGLWPSISLYTDPQVTPTATSPTMELDLLEAYSIGYNQPHFSWHLWGPSGQINASGAAPTMADISQGWHKYGIWIDTATIHFYMDDVQVFSFANPGGAGLAPFYLMFVNGYGGGFTVSLTPSQTYNMHVAYVACWKK